VTSFELLSKYMLIMLLRSDMMLCSNLGKRKFWCGPYYINVYVGHRFPPLP